MVKKKKKKDTHSHLFGLASIQSRPDIEEGGGQHICEHSLASSPSQALSLPHMTSADLKAVLDSSGLFDRC